MIRYRFCWGKNDDQVWLVGNVEHPELESQALLDINFTEGALTTENEWDAAVAQAKRQVRDALSEQARALRDAATKFLLENDPMSAVGEAEE